MKEVSKRIIKDFKLNELGIDFMGYEFDEINKLSIHHLIIPACKNGPLERWNIAPLCMLTAHPYLHTIEQFDYEKFLYLTSELININFQGYITLNDLIRINDLLCSFEREYSGTTWDNGNEIIKEKYTRRLLKK